MFTILGVKLIYRTVSIHSSTAISLLLFGFVAPRVAESGSDERLDTRSADLSLLLLLNQHMQFVVEFMERATTLPPF